MLTPRKTSVIVKSCIAGIELDGAIEISDGSIKITRLALDDVAAIIISRTQARVDFDGPAVVCQATTTASLLSICHGRDPPIAKLSNSCVGLFDRKSSGREVFIYAALRLEAESLEEGETF